MSDPLRLTALESLKISMADAYCEAKDEADKVDGGWIATGTNPVVIAARDRFDDIYRRLRAAELNAYGDQVVGIEVNRHKIEVSPPDA